MITSLGSVSAMRAAVRTNALQSLEYCANTILALGLEENLCSYVQDLVNDEENHLVHTKRPRALAIALSVWLQARGITVLSDVVVPRHEIVEWLELQGDDTSDLGVTILLHHDGVQLSWL